MRRTGYSISNVKAVQTGDIDNARRYNKRRFVLAGNITVLDIYIRRYSIIKKDNRTMLALEAEKEVSKKNRVQLLEILIVVSNKDLAYPVKEIVVVQNKVYIKLTTAEATEFQILEPDNKNIDKAAIETAENNLEKGAI